MSKPWQHAIVVGASSGIGEAVARRLAASGVRTALVARRKDELARIVEEINGAAGAPVALAFPHDVTDYAAVPALFQTICRELGGLDLIVYAAGVMPRLAGDEYPTATDVHTVQVNDLGAVAWLNEAAQRFGRTRAGVIVGISSVAGDRGRYGFPVYSASKAFLNTYLEGLRNRVGRYGVAVVTVKPGPVDTPMTKGLKMPLMIAPEVAAEKILRAAARRKRVAYVPAVWRPIMAIIRAIPSWLFMRLKI